MVCVLGVRVRAWFVCVCALVAWLLLDFPLMRTWWCMAVSGVSGAVCID